MCSVRPTGLGSWPRCYLSCTYMADLADIAAQYNLTLHAFADDNQLCIHCKPEKVQSAVASVQQWVTAIEQWMAASRLRLNMDKTELIWTGTKHNLSKIPGCGRALTLDAVHVAQSDDVRVLWVQLSTDLSLDKHVNVVSAKCFLLRNADMHSAYLLVGDVAGWVSVTRRYCIKTAKPILKLVRLSGSPIILVSSDPCVDTQFQGELLQRGR